MQDTGTSCLWNPSWGAMRLCPCFFSSSLTPVSSACATTQVTAAEGLLNVRCSQGLMGSHSIYSSRAQPQPSQSPPHASNLPSVPHCSLGVGMGLPMPLRTPASFTSPDLVAIRWGRCLLPDPDPSQLLAHIKAAWMVSNIPVWDTAAPGGKAPQLPPCSPWPPAPSLWGGGFASSPELTLEDKIIILLGVAHVVPAATRPRQGCRCLVSSFPLQSLEQTV